MKRNDMYRILLDPNQHVDNASLNETAVMEMSN